MVRKRLYILLFAAILLALAIGTVWKICNQREMTAQSDPRVESYVGNTKPLGPAPSNPQDFPTDVIIWKVALSEQSRTIDIKYEAVARHTLRSREGIEGYLKQIALGKVPSKEEWKTKYNSKPRDHDVERETPLSLEHRGRAYMVFVLDDKNWQFTAQHHPFEVLDGKEGYYLDPRCAWRVNATVAQTGERPPTGAECKVASFISNSGAEPLDDNGRFLSPFNLYVSLKLNSRHGPRLLPLVIDPDVGYPGGNYP